MQLILNLIKKLIKIGGCDACASFSFKLKRNSYDGKYLCDECSLELETEVNL